MINVNKLHDTQTLGHPNVFLTEPGQTPTPAQYCKKAQWGYETDKEFMPEDTLPKTIEVLPAQVVDFADLLEDLDNLTY